jgi:hypothetical protein
MKKIISILGILLLALQFTVYSQEIRTYIGTANRSEVILDTKAHPNGGAVMVGYSTVLDATNNYDYTTTDFLIVRVDDNGSVIWNHRMGVANLEDFLNSVIIAANGNIIAAGYVNHVPWNIVSPNASAAAIYCFDEATGVVCGSNFVGLPSGIINDKGAIYRSVIQLDNGDFVAVGARDARPGSSDAMVTCFDGNTLAVNWNRTFLIPNTDGADAVTQLNNRIFIGGGFVSTSLYDLNITELDATGAFVWTRAYAYTFSNPDLSLNLTNNVIEEIKVVNNELYILTTSFNDWMSTAGSMSGILRTDLAGNTLSFRHFNNMSFPYSHLGSVDYEDPTTAYYVINPGNASMNLHAPVTGNLVVHDAELAIVDPVNGGIISPINLVHTGNQSLLSTNLYNGDAYWGGTSENDPVQPGGLDVFYVKSIGGLPTHSQDCPANPAPMLDGNVPITDITLSFNMNLTHQLLTPNIDDHPEILDEVMLCSEEPCEVEDLTWCGSLASPLTYTFNVTTNPAGANVIWDFGDFTGPFPSTAGTPINHTYATPGSYTVCVDVLDAAGAVCTTVCIQICIPDVAGLPKPGKTQAQSSTLDINDKNSNLAIGDLYPNPTDGTLNIPVTTQTGDEVSIRIIRMDGVVMYDAKETLEEGRQTLKVNLGNLTPGNYMCEIRDNKTRNTRVFTKQ